MYKVKQFLHANQFILYDNDSLYLQSYNTIVASIKRDRQFIDGTLHDVKKITLGKHWNYSKTTSVHVYAFLEKYANIEYNTTNKRLETQKLIDSGIILYNADME